MSLIYTQHVTADHAIGLPVGGAGTTITVLSGDSVYYGDSQQVSSGSNIGTLTLSSSVTVTGPLLWVRSASQSDLTVTTLDAASGPLVVEAVDVKNASGASYALPDVTTDTLHLVTLTANCTLTFPAAAAGKSFTVALVQDGTGSRTATWPGSVKWSAGTAPTLTTTASKTDVLSFVCFDGTNWLGFVSGTNF